MKTLSQTTSKILMIRPAAFEKNPDTVHDNAFQKGIDNLSAAEIQQKALHEFDTLVATLRQNKIDVFVFEDTPEPEKPDAIFPNNWVTFHHDGKVILYPMMAKNRRLERRRDILEALEKEHSFQITEVIDLSPHEKKEKFLEGTGSLIFDHPHRKIYATLSKRTDLSLLEAYAKRFCYEWFAFQASQRAGKKWIPVYHTNVLMHLGEDVVVVALEMIRDQKEGDQLVQHLEKAKKTILEISEKQVEHFVGNMIQLQNREGKRCLVLSTQAWGALTTGQKNLLSQKSQIVTSPLDTIEACGGGSARCLIAEIFLPRKT